MRFKVNWGGVLGAVTSVVGILSHPEVLAVLPEKIALIVSGVGIILQAVSKPVAVKNDGT